MDFMNLNQAAHGDREFGFIAARLRLERKVVVGHWSDARSRSGSGRGRGPRAPGPTGSAARIARFGDNMRDVAVTEGDKVEAQRRLGFSVNTYGVGDLVAVGRRRVRHGRGRARGASTSTSTTWSRRASGRAAPSAGSCATAPGSSSASAGSSPTAASPPSPTTFEDLHGLDAAPRPGRAAPDGGRLRLRRARATGRPRRWSAR